MRIQEIAGRLLPKRHPDAAEGSEFPVIRPHPHDGSGPLCNSIRRMHLQDANKGPNLLNLSRELPSKNRAPPRHGAPFRPSGGRRQNERRSSLCPHTRHPRIRGCRGTFWWGPCGGDGVLIGTATGCALCAAGESLPLPVSFYHLSCTATNSASLPYLFLEVGMQQHDTSLRYGAFPWLTP